MIHANQQPPFCWPSHTPLTKLGAQDQACTCGALLPNPTCMCLPQVQGPLLAPTHVTVQQACSHQATVCCSTAPKTADKQRPKRAAARACCVSSPTQSTHSKCIPARHNHTGRRALHKPCLMPVNPTPTRGRGNHAIRTPYITSQGTCSSKAQGARTVRIATSPPLDPIRQSAYTSCFKTHLFAAAIQQHALPLLCRHHVGPGPCHSTSLPVVPRSSRAAMWSLGCLPARWLGLWQHMRHAGHTVSCQPGRKLQRCAASWHALRMQGSQLLCYNKCAHVQSHRQNLAEISMLT